MPAASRVSSQRNEEFDLRERATADRLTRFRGEMCDLDFAHLVSEVLRLQDKREERPTKVPDAFQSTRRDLQGRKLTSVESPVSSFNRL